MTLHGMCHNSSRPETTMSSAQGVRYHCQTARSLAYYGEDLGYWKNYLANAKELAENGIRNSLLSNTETLGGNLLSLEFNKDRFRQFINLALGEYQYYDNNEGRWRVPFHETESENEIDTAGWTDGNDQPITARKVFNYTLALWEVIQEYDNLGVEVTGPSFIGGPLSAMPMDLAYLFNSDGRIKKQKHHFYGRSIAGQPQEPFIYESLEQAISELETYYGPMQIGMSENGCWTNGLREGAQSDYVKAFFNYNHPKVYSMELFGINDWLCTDWEYQNGRDYGIIDRDGNEKQAAIELAAMFSGEPPVEYIPPATQMNYNNSSRVVTIRRKK